MNDFQTVVLALLLVGAVLMALWLYNKSYELVRENDRLRMNNLELGIKLKEDNEIGNIHWRHWAITSPGVNVGMDPTEQLRVSLEAEGHEAEKVIAALRDAGRL